MKEDWTFEDFVETDESFQRHIEDSLVFLSHDSGADHRVG